MSYWIDEEREEKYRNCDHKGIECYGCSVEQIRTCERMKFKDED